MPFLLLKTFLMFFDFLKMQFDKLKGLQLCFSFLRCLLLLMTI